MRVWESEIRRTLIGESPHLFYTIPNYLSSGEARLEKVINRGNILNPVLVETAETPGVFFHPVNLPGEYGLRAYRKALRDRLLVIKMVAFYTAVFVLIALAFDSISKTALVMSGFGLVVTLYAYVDYREVFLTRELLAERCCYYGWLFLACRPYLALFLLFYLSSGILQFLLAGENFLDRYGMSFEQSETEWWRILTGSLIHSGVAHWLSNLSLSIVIAAACGPVLRAYVLPIFLLGGMVSFYLVLFFNGIYPSEEHVGLVGTSGGLAALLGAQLVLIFRYRKSYPFRYGLTILYFVLISLILGSLFMNSSSLGCHIFGLAAGVFLGFFVPDYLKVDESTTP